MEYRNNHYFGLPRASVRSGGPASMWLERLRRAAGSAGHVWHEHWPGA